jgi:hypothetical protein
VVGGQRQHPDRTTFDHDPYARLRLVDVNSRLPSGVVWARLPSGCTGDDYLLVSPADPHDDSPATAPSASPEDAAPRRRRNPWVWVSGVLALIAVGLLVWALAATSDRDGTQHELTSTQQQLDTTNQELDQTKEDLEQQQESSEASTDESDGSGGAVAAVGGLAAANRCTTT